MRLVSSNACRGYDYKWLIHISQAPAVLFVLQVVVRVRCYILMCLPKKYEPICVLLSINKTIMYVFSIYK